MQILRSLSDAQLERFQKITFQKGEILHQEGDICIKISFVIKGSIRIASYSLNGNEIVYNQIQSGGMFGNNLAFASDNQYRGNVIASSDGYLLQIDKSLLLKLLQENEEFLFDYLQVESDFVKKLNSKMKLMSFPLAEERLDYLFYLQGNEIAFSSISNLAKELFLSREVLSRLIHKEEKNGKLKIEKNKLIRL